MKERFELSAQLVNCAPRHEELAHDAVNNVLKLARITAIADHKAMNAADRERIKAEYAKAMAAVSSCTDILKKWVNNDVWTQDADN